MSFPFKPVLVSPHGAAGRSDASRSGLLNRPEANLGGYVLPNMASPKTFPHILLGQICLALHRLQPQLTCATNASDIAEWRSEMLASTTS